MLKKVALKWMELDTFRRKCAEITIRNQLRLCKKREDRDTWMKETDKNTDLRLEGIYSTKQHIAKWIMNRNKQIILYNIEISQHFKNRSRKHTEISIHGNMSNRKAFCNTFKDCNDIINIKPKNLIQVIRLIDCLTKLRISESSYWNSIEYYVCRSKLLQGVDNIQFIEIIYKGFHFVSTLESISVEEVYENLEPVLELCLDNSQLSKTTSIHEGVKSLIEIFYCLVVNLEGSSNIHLKIMKNLSETLSLLSLSDLCRLLKQKHIK